MRKIKGKIYKLINGKYTVKVRGGYIDVSKFLDNGKWQLWIFPENREKFSLVNSIGEAEDLFREYVVWKREPKKGLKLVKKLKED